MRSILGTTVLPGEVKMDVRRVEVVWEALTPHPVVMAKTSAAHRQVKALHPYRGVMLLGYGDWDTNQGPVSVIGYDLATLAPVTLFGPCPSEAFDRIRVIDGRAYLPWTDPRTNHRGGFTTDRSGTWANEFIGPEGSMIHTFDLAMIDDKLHACGSTISDDPAQGHGVVWREEAPGQWVEVLRSTGRAPLARFYGFHRNGDRWLVQTSNPTQETWGTYDGVSWAPVPGHPNLQLSSTDRAVSPPAGYTNHGAVLNTSRIHDGWVWVAGSSGVVKRARLP